ncbi:MAG: Na/Pi symporter [Myxococcota bacterium]|nr:Na/Pi symporter [Myxococcota bacterium]
MAETSRLRVTSSAITPWLNGLAAVVLLYLFLVGVSCLSGGIKGLGAGVMNQYLGDDLNPFLALLGGILATTLVQSSSVTTALIVGLVASGEVATGTAVPMIMGANIGTTVTNTIASLAHATRAQEFKRAFAAATCHDFFNFLSVIVLLPVELLTRAMWGEGILERAARVVADWTVGSTGAKYKSPFKTAIKSGREVVKDGLGFFADDQKLAAILLALVGCVIIFSALGLIVKVMRILVMGKFEGYINRFLGSGGIVGIVVGMVLTVMVQSSSITTSVMVPLAGAGLVSLGQVFSITVGANIGTTVTALLASMVVSGDTMQAARQIALVHLFFNFAGIAVWYLPQVTRKVPMMMAEAMAEYATGAKKWALFYVMAVFYGLPAAIFFLTR